jgi:hypothetical protein
MNTFRTQLNAGVSKHTLSLDHHILTLGSCFADSIGTRLTNYKIQTLPNPFGIVYNPEAIHKTIRYAVFNESAPEHTYLQQNDIHLNYDFHSGLSAMNRKDLEQKLNNITGTVHHFLKNANYLLITYGTSWAYERSDTGEVVANCHKQPSSFFRKSLLTQKKILESFESAYKVLKTFNPAIRIILTVSPVRHIKDTLELNSVSKSILRVACHSIQEQYTDVEYFPAYEILLDDLRDYRFYKSDMIHPSEEAEEYIWEQFTSRYFSMDLKNFASTWKSIRQAITHKPFHAESSAHQYFLRETLKRLEELQDMVDVKSEIQKVKESLLP